jgi:hypothetical protein
MTTTRVPLTHDNAKVGAIVYMGNGKVPYEVVDYYPKDGMVWIGKLGAKSSSITRKLRSLTLEP